MSSQSLSVPIISRHGQHQRHVRGAVGSKLEVDAGLWVTSALPSKADIGRLSRHARNVPATAVFVAPADEGVSPGDLFRHTGQSPRCNDPVDVLRAGKRARSPEFRDGLARAKAQDMIAGYCGFLRTTQHSERDHHLTMELHKVWPEPNAVGCPHQSLIIAP